MTDKKTLILTPIVYEDEGREFEKLLCNGDSIFETRDLAQDSPEDATLQRDMTSSLEVANFMETAFKLALIYDRVEVKDIFRCTGREEFDNMGRDKS